MKHDKNSLQQLAALNALGALDADEAALFARLLSERSETRDEAARFDAISEALAQSLPGASQPPPPGLRDRILREVELKRKRAHLESTLRGLAPPTRAGFAYLRDTAGGGWLPLPVPGASVKLLAYDPTTDYAVVLGKLEAGTHYPAHDHRRAEDIYMLQGDLHVGEEVIRTGDFHHAEAGSRHGVNWSEAGCILLAVLSKEDLLAQFTAG